MLDRLLVWLTAAPTVAKPFTGADAAVLVDKYGFKMAAEFILAASK